MKRKSNRNRSKPKPAKSGGHGGQPHFVPAMHFPWDSFFVRFVDDSETHEGWLEIEYAGIVVDELPLSLAQTAVLRMLAAKVLDSGTTHRAGALISAKVILKELSRQFDDALGLKVWDGRAVHDLMYDIRGKLRASHAARWAAKEVGEEIDFGMLIIAYDTAYRRYGLNVPKDRFEIVEFS